MVDLVPGSKSSKNHVEHSPKSSKYESAIPYVVSNIKLKMFRHIIQAYIAKLSLFLLVHFFLEEDDPLET
jgi:hypothetical protein